MSDRVSKQYRKNLKKGEVIFTKGEVGNHLIYLEKGILDVIINDRKVNSIDAAVSQDFVGEVGAILGTPRTADIVAATDCTVLYLPKIGLESIIKTSPSLGIKLILSLCNKLISTSSALEELQAKFAEFKSKESSLLESGNTETSLKNYMKGLLYLIEAAAEDSKGDKVIELLKYFLETNPWSILHGKQDFVLHDSALMNSNPHSVFNEDN